MKKYGDNTKIKIINVNDRKLTLNKSIEFELLSSIRINLNRNDYLKIEEKLIKSTKINLARIFNNYKSYKTFFLGNETFFIPKILEFDLTNYFNIYFGHFEIIKKYIHKESPDKLIFFNCNPYFFKFFKDLRFYKKRVLIYNDSLLYKSKNVLKLISFFYFILFIIGRYFTSKFYKPFKQNKIQKKYVENNILFVIKTKNQLKSVKPVYDSLKKEKKLNPIYYFIETFLNFRDIAKLFRFFFNMRRVLSRNQKNLFLNVKYNSINLQKILKLFDSSQFFIRLARIFNCRNNLNRFIQNQTPALVIIGNDFKGEERIAADYFKSRRIPTLYIPHAAIPVIEEFVSKPDIMYYVLGGERDKEFYKIKGIPGENIEVVGIPRYENLYQGKIHKLKSVKDMFNGIIYNFSKDKFTVLLTTNPIDDKANEKIITSVVNSLKQLNLIDNLIIKLHPHENGKIHKEVIHKLKVNPIIVKSYNILDIIKSCNLLISQKSTTLLEAMIIGTPMILLDYINKNFDQTSKYEFLDEKFIPTVKDPKNLLNELEKILNRTKENDNINKELKEFSSEFSYFDHGKSPTEKIIQFIKKIINYQD